MATLTLQNWLTAFRNKEPLNALDQHNRAKSLLNVEQSKKRITRFTKTVPERGREIETESRILSRSSRKHVAFAISSNAFHSISFYLFILTRIDSIQKKNKKKSQWKSCTKESTYNPPSIQLSTNKISTRKVGMKKKTYLFRQWICCFGYNTSTLTHLSLLFILALVTCIRDVTLASSMMFSAHMCVE